MPLLDLVDAVASDVIRSSAAQVDRTGDFPGTSIQALREAGLLGLAQPVAVGGLGGTPGDCALGVRRVAQACASTAMIWCMHLCGAVVIQAHGSDDAKRAVASGAALTTLAFSEAGSRSHFWAPLSTARRVAGGVRLDAKKSWVTSASRADLYVWSSQPIEAEGPSTIWLVPTDAPGLSTHGPFDGLGLRGNDSSPVTAEGVVLPESARLGADGGGFGVMMEIVLPYFNLMNAGCSLGIAEAAVAAAVTHCAGTRYAHLDSALRDLPTIRNSLARMRCKADMGHALLLDAIAAVEGGRPDAMLRVLEVKAVAAETALEVTALAMRVCGGAAFRKDVGVERHMRDAQAASVMAPTTDVLYDFIGKAITGMELF
ncbi:MAG: acyl-CoA/acyl-ACP dehydrogenase [Alphaproteobacteria bacterium]|nr:acyl-CoA/acyl-ACP dehydrogenase [Alphaproteobacteria bacterium]